MRKKLRFVMSLLLVALASGQVWATETVSVRSYSSTKLSQVPVDCSYGEWGYHSQMIYQKNLLEEAKLPMGAVITAITFYTYRDYPLINPEGEENNPLTIKLGQPEIGNLNSFVTENLKTVTTSGNIWSGTTSVTLEFDVDKAYTYNGGNLLIDLSWAYHPDGYYKKDPTIYWYCGTSYVGASIYANNDGNGNATTATTANYLPDIDITYEQRMPYSAEVTPESLHFGSALVGSPKEKDIALQNMGVRDFTYTVSGLDAPFSTTVTEGTLAAGAEDVVIPVAFAPTETGAFEDDLVITFAPETRLEPITIHVTGKGSDAVCDGTDESEFMPINGWCYDFKQINQMIYPASYLAAIDGKRIESLTFYSTKANLFKGGKYNVSVGLTDQKTFSGPNRITGLQTVAADLVAVAGKTELTINFDQPFAYEAGKNLVVEFEVTEPGTNDIPYTERTYFYGVNQSGDVSFYSWGDTKKTSKFLPKMKIKEAAPIGNSYLDIADYAAIDEAGATVGGMKTIYKYTEKNGQAWLTLACYGAMAADENLNWLETSSLNSYYDSGWSATDVFKGATTYFGSNYSYSICGTGTQTFYVTNCSQVKAYVEGNDYTTTNATLTIYECSRNVDNTATSAAEAFDTKQSRDGVITSESIDPAKIYKVVLTGGGDFPSLLEIGFQKPLPKNVITLFNDDSESAEKNADIISGAAGNGLVYDVTLADRTLYKDGLWNTLCLPFDASINDAPLVGATVMELDTDEQNGFDPTDGTLYLTFKPATAIKAGVPYLVKWTSGTDINNPVFEGVSISSTAAQPVVSATSTLETVQMVGTYSPVSVKADDKSILYLESGNALCYPAVDLQIRSCRAYFSVPYIQEHAEAQARAFVLSFDGEETGIETISIPSTPSTPSNSSNLSNFYFTLDGRRLDKPSGPGLYIHNGRKVLIK